MKNELFSSKTMLSTGLSGAAVASPAFAATDLEADLEMVAEDEALLVAEGSCGEGTCGEGGRGEEGSCGEGSCGEGEGGGEEGSCGEGSCGEGGGEEGSCGEGTCGG
ncbi:hypothetical protein [Thioalkalivibrio sp.]|uniref:HvfA family oxazolone/thioamide-modified RiPP metallophore n=1 Tax=Thioalkalivibrio sp. TaxID=2093813 RepID=UPI003976CF46